MDSKINTLDETEAKEENAQLPPSVNNNLREKVGEIEPEQYLELINLLIKSRKKEPPKIVIEPQPIPSHPIEIHWVPEILNFEIKAKPVLRKLLLCNRSPRSIYLQVCGVQGDTAEITWSWCPRRRLLLAPGLQAVIFITATPRKPFTPREDFAAIVLAAEHKRDFVIGYFNIGVHIECLSETLSRN